MSCPICEKRRPERYCPSRGEKICAICCGKGREVTIDCPSDCSHLLSARRYEVEHRKPLASEKIPFPGVELSLDVIRRNQAALAGISLAILKSAQENPALRDSETLTALAALAETSRTLESGIYFERPPDAPLPRALYVQLVRFLDEFKKQEAQQAGFSQLKNSEIFRLIVFLLRIGRRESNGKPRSRAFLDFLGAQFPAAPETQTAAPRIIVP
ncbi:MAG TPA: hypothetical protein VGT03_15735 [Candidatus Acidoferrales bacterium]|nr:hypothetical protein [Candidatus Acidoferrales bacterium]